MEEGGRKLLSLDSQENKLQWRSRTTVDRSDRRIDRSVRMVIAPVCTREQG